MTTGYRESGIVGSDFHSYKSWIGDDGKYHPGTKIIKVNNYAMEAATLYKMKGTIKDGLPWIPPEYWTCGAVPGSYWDCSVTESSGWTSNDTLSLLGKLASKTKGHKFQLGTFLATGHQATSQAVSSITAIGSAMVSLKRLQFAKAFRALGYSPGQRAAKRIKGKAKQGDISGAWLAMQYGWLPTLSDIHEAWKAYEVHTASERKVTIIAKKQKIKDYEASVSPSLYSCHGDVIERRRIAYTMTEYLPVARSLGLTDPLSVLWEIVPWSFVIDWFLPIGSYLEALNVIPSLKGSFVSTTYTTFKNAKDHDIDPRYSACKPGRSIFRKVNFTRTQGDSLSVPLPSFVPLPDAMSPLRIYNAVALAHQQLLRFKR